MGEMSFGAARHAALAVRSRRRLLEVLQSAGEPMGIAALAAAVGLHVTTARAHLQVLEQAALVRRAADRSGRMGRPRQLYVAAGAAEVNEGYRQLAAALAGALAAAPAAGADWAERAGRQWARDVLPVAERLSWEQAACRLAGLFEWLGFAPRVIDDAGCRHLELDGCPFRDLARAYPQVVCTVHRGLLLGALERLGSPGAHQARLRPFVGPELCITDLPTPSGLPEGTSPP